MRRLRYCEDRVGALLGMIRADRPRSSANAQGRILPPPARPQKGAIPAPYHWLMAKPLRPTRDDEHAPVLLAEADGVSKQETAVRAIHEAASRSLREDKIRTLSARARERYTDLLDRLGR